MAHLGLYGHSLTCTCACAFRPPRLAGAKSAGEEEAERDKGRMVEMLNERSRKMEELEKVLVQLSTDPEMKSIQDEHERDKAEMTKRSMVLQEELRTSEHNERTQRKVVDAQLEGVIHTARNLGQIAAYFLQTGAMEEAADFYNQAQTIFNDLLGPDHPKTQQWQEDLFFLINAPAIQSMVKSAAKTLAPESEVASKEGSATAPEWWMQNLYEMGSHDSGGGGDDEGSTNWWMQNLYDMNTRSGFGQETNASGDDSDYMGIIFGTPRGDGTSTARGGPAFTPRGTLVALSQANGKGGAAMSLGVPLQQKDGTIPEEETDAINMGFAKDWVQKVFLTPRASGDDGANVEAEMADAVEWLQMNFGTPRGSIDSRSGAGSIGVPITPRGGGATAAQLNLTKKADDAVFHAAMQATLSTPRAPTGTASVDDTPMAGAVNKMFKGKLQHV